VTRSRASAKAAGASFERALADWFAWRLKDDRIDRRVKRGANDRGDIGGLRTVTGARIVAELKDYGGRILASTWLAEAAVEAGNDDAPIGVVIAKRKGTTDPARQFVLMDVETFARLIEGGLDATSP
jgi:hypothetical protein